MWPSALVELGHRVVAIDPILPVDLVDADLPGTTTSSPMRISSPSRSTRLMGDATSCFWPCTAEPAKMAACSGFWKTGKFLSPAQVRPVPTGDEQRGQQAGPARRPGFPRPRMRRSTPRRRFDLLAAQAAAIGFPVVVKPDAQGSSLGVGLAQDLVDLVACRDEVLRLDRRGLVEPLVEGREFTLSIVGRQPLPLVEVLAAGSLFSYADKYAAGPAHCRAVDDLPPATLAAIRHAALATADVLDTRGLVRVDVRLDESGEPWVLELNAIPGLTPASLAPFAAGLAGWTFAQLCDRLVREGLAECRQSEMTASIAAM